MPSHAFTSSVYPLRVSSFALPRTWRAGCVTHFYMRTEFDNPNPIDVTVLVNNHQLEITTRLRSVRYFLSDRHEFAEQKILANTKIFRRITSR